MNAEPHRNQLWKARVLMTALVVFFYILSEWLFFLTKPSSLSLAPWAQTLMVLATAPILPVLLACAIILLCWVLSAFWENPFFVKFLRGVSLFLPALILASTLFLMIDNFTVTIFGVGIRSFQFPQTLFYVAILTVLLTISYRWLVRWERQIAHKLGSRNLSLGLTSLITLLLVTGSVSYVTARPASIIGIADSPPMEKLPSILFIGSDGVNADHMSVYGYSKDTTPYISEFAKAALVFNNAYANASRTLASLVSMLTGKLPTATRVTCPPDILHGEDVFQHMPGILRRQHYRSIQLTVRGYGDAYDANMRMAFDSVNFRSADEIVVLELTQELLNGEASYLLNQIYERLSERLLHIFGIRKMSDPFAEVMGAKRETYPDSKKLSALLEFIGSSEDPFFAHIHLMGTHKNKIKVKGSGKNMAAAEDSVDDIPAFYDEAIRKFDQNFEKVIRFLEESNRLENTVVVLYSDHGWKHATKVRVPLMIRFPKRAHTGIIEERVQNIDIAPTILDYLNIGKPQWMAGESLISSRIDPCRPVISVWPIRTYDQQLKWKHRAEAKPPFFTLGAVSLVTCSHYFKYDLERRKLSGERINNLIPACSECEVLERPEVIRLIHEHLSENGYDISVLE